LKITSGETTYFARRYRDEQEVVTFHGFDRRSESAPQWRGGIPYEDADFVAAVQAVLDIPGVLQVEVFTSNETGLPERVDLSRISPT
jgi:hypothetical protein